MSKTPFLPSDVSAVREIIFIKREIEDDFFGDSNIVRPGTQKQEMGLATVLDVGPKVDTIKTGDKIYLGKLSGLKVTELDGSYFLVHQNEVMAIVRT